MKNIKQFIESGIVEQYVTGIATAEEKKEVEEMAASFPEIRKEITELEMVMESYAQLNAVSPDPTIKSFLMATIDYTERMKNGEKPSFPPIINPDSKIEDYSEWINRADMVVSADLKDFYARIIGYAPDALTAIVWIKEMAPVEVHNKELEKFLILEGTCDITIENEVHHLAPGDVLSIPLYKKHFVKITSEKPCKIILQRIAAWYS
jgi:mannose-6-phosphate isomerase-like protein (cupin superfamily)